MWVWGALGDAGSPQGELTEGPALNTVFSVFSKQGPSLRACAWCWGNVCSPLSPGTWICLRLHTPSVRCEMEGQKRRRPAPTREAWAQVRQPGHPASPRL